MVPWKVEPSQARSTRGAQLGGGGGAWPGPGPPGGSRLARPPVPLPICLSGEWGEPGWSVAGSDGSSKTTEPKTVAPDRNGGLLIS